MSDIGRENKEKAQMIYKFFKYYFCEKEKERERENSAIQDRIQVYKEFIKNVIHPSIKDEKIDDINDILFRNNLTHENLMNHKKSINFLMGLLNDQREKNYMMHTDYEILSREMNFWITDFDTFKVNKELRVI